MFFEAGDAVSVVALKPGVGYLDSQGIGFENAVSWSIVWKVEPLTTYFVSVNTALLNSVLLCGK